MSEPVVTRRWMQILLFLTMVANCWLLTQVVHELGHVVAATLGGGSIERVVLSPWSFSRTDVFPNPHPLIEVWAGPVVGTLLPLALWGICRWRNQELVSGFSRFFAGFAAIVNGVYIGFGPATDGMDTQMMLDAGCQRWQLLLFGLPAIALGLWLWHGTGRVFGIGAHAQPVRPQTAIVSTVLCLAIVLAELSVVRLIP